MDDPVREYIDRVLRLQDERRAVTLTQADLEDIAREVGLTDDDLVAVHAEVQAHRARAAGFRRHDLLDDAIIQLREALALAPTDPDIAMELADALVSSPSSDPNEARELALKVLDLDPNRDDAFALVAKIRKPKTTLFAPQPQLGALPTTATGADITVLPWVSAQAVYEDAAYYNFQGWFRNDTAHELEEFEATLLLKTDDGVVDDQCYIMSTAHPPLRPGEALPHVLTTSAPRHTVRSVEFRMHSIATVPAPTKYPNPKPCPYSWKIDQPEGITLTVGERARTQAHGHFYLALVMTNTSERTLDVLEFKVTGRSADGTVCGESLVRVGGASSPPFLPGEQRQNKAWIATTLDVVDVTVEVVTLR